MHSIDIQGMEIGVYKSVLVENNFGITCMVLLSFPHCDRLPNGHVIRTSNGES